MEATKLTAMTNPERFWTLVNKTSETGCWLWKRKLEWHGYGRFWADGRPQYAHRIAYELMVGPIPDGLQLDHLCRVRHCVNPAHLEPVTPGENQRRGYLAGRAKPGSPPGTRQGGAFTNLEKTHCPKGHPYSGDNLYVTKQGHRQCKTCTRERNQSDAGKEYQRQYRLRRQGRG